MGVPLNMGTFGPVGLKHIFYTLTSFIRDNSGAMHRRRVLLFFRYFLHQSKSDTKVSIPPHLKLFIV